MAAQRKVAIALRNFIWWTMRTIRADYFLARFAGQNRLLKKALPRHIQYRGEEYSFRISANLELLIDRSDYTQWRVFAGGITIHPVIAGCLGLRENLVIADVGANIGAYSALLTCGLNSTKTVIHLFEPNPYIFKRLQRNTERIMNAHAGVTCFGNNYAVGERSDKLQLHVKARHSGAGSLLGNETGVETFTVDVVSLDGYVEANTVQDLHFLKIDVESFEPAVFHGAFNSISRFLPVLYFEYSQGWYNHFPGDYVDEIFDFLRSTGYSLFIERGHDLEETNGELLRGVGFANVIGINQGG